MKYTYWKHQGGWVYRVSKLPNNHFIERYANRYFIERYEYLNLYWREFAYLDDPPSRENMYDCIEIREESNIMLELL